MIVRAFRYTAKHRLLRTTRKRRSHFKKTWHNHGTIIGTGITCRKIPCYIRNSASRWFIVKKAKLFWSYLKHFWILAGVKKRRILIGLCTSLVLENFIVFYLRKIQFKMALTQIFPWAMRSCLKFGNLLKHKMYLNEITEKEI